jgi:glucan phosphoethanolaminetransferase (alkaline phosphatase superfamily)
MKKIIIFLFIIILLTFFGIIFFYLPKIDIYKITGRTVENTYSFTKAICNETNYCQDYEIICNSKGLVTAKPITSAAVQYPAYWKDPRDNETISRLCE